MSNTGTKQTPYVYQPITVWSCYILGSFRNCPTCLRIDQDQTNCQNVSPLNYFLTDEFGRLFIHYISFLLQTESLVLLTTVFAILTIWLVWYDGWDLFVVYERFVSKEIRVFYHELSPQSPPVADVTSFTGLRSNFVMYRCDHSTMGCILNCCAAWHWLRRAGPAPACLCLAPGHGQGSQQPFASPCCKTELRFRIAKQRLIRQ